MTRNTRSLVGQVVWIFSPNPHRLPFIAYIAGVDEITATVEFFMVHEEEDLATADDLTYGREFHDHRTALVVQPRLSAEVSLAYVGPGLTRLSTTAIDEIAQMASGHRRIVERTGVLVRSTEEFRWDNVVEQKRHLDAVLDDIGIDKYASHALLNLSQRRSGEPAEIARKYVVSLLEQGDLSMLNITKQLLENLGLPGLGADFIASCVNTVLATRLDDNAVRSTDEIDSGIQAARDELRQLHPRKEAARV